MSKKEKLIERLLKMPKDFTFDEMASLLSYFDYELKQGGKRYVLQQVIEKLQKEGLL